MPGDWVWFIVAGYIFIVFFSKRVTKIAEEAEEGDEHLSILFVALVATLIVIVLCIGFEIGWLIYAFFASEYYPFVPVALAIKVYFFVATCGSGMLKLAQKDHIARKIPEIPDETDWVLLAFYTYVLINHVFEGSF